MKILLSGGGTLGPVTPLLAMREVIVNKYTDATFVWVGSETGPEREFIKNYDIKFISISSGKFRRYISFLNVLDIFRVIKGVFESIKLLKAEKPNGCISAGGFVSVPLHWAAWLLGIPTWIHQQDIQKGMSNEVMSPFATLITTALKQQLKGFPKKKTRWIGNPVRKDILNGNKEKAKQIFSIKSDLPVVFVTGGGTGSLRVNQLVVDSLEALKGKAQIIHLTGKERSQELAKNAMKHFDDYHVFQSFSDEMKHAYAIADVVVSRGGFGTISELAALGKPSILVPKPGHQEENVDFLKKSGAVVFVDEDDIHRDALSREIIKLIDNKARRDALGDKLKELLPQARENDIINSLNSLVIKK